MRHLRSILYALVLAPAVWILCGVGFDQDLTGRARDNGGLESLSGMLLLVLAGTAYAILLFAPISPAGPTVAGLVYLAIGAWARLAPESYAGLWPADVTKEGFNVSTPGYGLAVLLAVPLICTALSAKRWAAYEPPQILLIGTLGRARGAAPVAGPRMAAEQTTVIPPAPSGDATQVIGHTGPASEAIPAGGDDGEEKTTVLRLDPPAPTAPTSAKPAPAPAGPAPAAADAGSADQGEPTTVMVSGKAAGRRSEAADEPTGPMAVEDEPTRDVAASSAATQDAAATRDTAATQDAAATRDMAASDEPTHDMGAAEQPTHDMGAAEQPTHDMGAAEQPTHDLGAAGRAAEQESAGDEKTQLLSLPTPDETTRHLGGEAPTHPLSHGEETQVIGVLPPAASGERTQVIRAGTVEPPGDRTQLLTLPAPGEAATVPTPPGETTKPMSIVGEERPDPGEDPTTRLLPPPAEPATPPAPDPGEATTRRNAMTVSNLERPADEAEDDTRPLSPPKP